MTVNKYEFFLQRTVAGLTTENISLDKQPFGDTVPQYSALYCELTVCISGSTNSKMAMEKWILCWRYSAANTLSTDSADQLEVRLGTVGINGPSAVTAEVVAGNAIIDVTTKQYTGDKMVCRGVVWVGN